LRASDYPNPAEHSGIQRYRFPLALRIRPSHPGLDRLPKLRVAGSNPVVRFN
jgi:hypothetical protein